MDAGLIPAATSQGLLEHGLLKTRVSAAPGNLCFAFSSDAPFSSEGGGIAAARGWCFCARLFGLEVCLGEQAQHYQINAEQLPATNSVCSVQSGDKVNDPRKENKMVLFSFDTSGIQSSSNPRLVPSAADRNSL